MMHNPVFESHNACLYFFKYVDRKGSAAMLTTKRSTGVTPEVNVMNLMKPRVDVARSPKQ